MAHPPPRLRRPSRFGAAAVAGRLALCAAAGASTVAATPGDGIAEPLTTTAASAERGRALVANRQQSLCVLCHQVPLPEVRFQGDISTNLAGAGARWSAAQMRLRLVNPRALNPDSIMPAYFTTAPRSRVGVAWRDKPILDAQQIEDVIAWLQTLR
ncbi:MAG: sulfur oxidation c-type cytochrome SoxX [Burkholderiales bacterium]|nr:sulfur oxidation c-type cytochrome SoxX [Burkholderiales bacterium]